MLRNVVFIQLAEEADGEPIEVLRTGTFIDMHGKEITITEADLDRYVANFEAGSAGQDVPIDVNHERKEAAGWIKSLYREGVKLMAVPDWNELGRGLVGDKVYKYLSATIDTAKKVVKAVSLVNFPAVKGLKPVELSEGVYAFEQQGFFEAIQEMIHDALGRTPAPAQAHDQVSLADGIPGSVTISQYLQASMHKVFTNIADNLALSGYLSDEERKELSAAVGDAMEAFTNGAGEAAQRLIPSPNYYPNDHYFSENQPSQRKETEAMTDEEKQALREQIRQELEAEMTEEQQTKAELREAVRQEVEAELAAKFELKQDLIAFADKLCGGEAGLSAKPEDVVSFLEALPEEQVEAAKALLQAKVADFSEHGSDGDGQRKPKLPDHARADVKSGELTVAELFKAKVLGGQMDDYDLSEFTDDQIGL